MNIVEKNKDKIIALCKKHNVRYLSVFGSVLTNRFTNESDIDFVVHFNEIDLFDYADNYFDLKFSLQNLLHREIDLLEAQSIKNPYLRRSIDGSKKIVYG